MTRTLPLASTMEAVQESRIVRPLPTLLTSFVKVRDGPDMQEEMAPLHPHNKDHVPEKKSKLAAEESPMEKDDETPKFTPPPLTATNCEMITTTMTYSEPGVKPWPYTGCVTNLSGWIPDYTIAISTPEPSTTTTETSASPTAPTTATPSSTQHKSPKTTAIVASTVFAGLAFLAGIGFLIWRQKRAQSRKGGSSNAGARSTLSSTVGGPWEMNRVSGKPLEGNTTTVTAGFEDVRPDWTTGGHRNYGFARGGRRG